MLCLLLASCIMILVAGCTPSKSVQKKVLNYLHDDYGFSLQECLNRIYRSKLYKKLSTESTKYWHLGPVDLYNELKTEL